MLSGAPLAREQAAPPAHRARQQGDGLAMDNVGTSFRGNRTGGSDGPHAEAAPDDGPQDDAPRAESVPADTLTATTANAGAAQPNTARAAKRAPSRPHFSRRAGRLALIALVIIVGVGTVWWLRSGSTVSTDDAYLNADVAQIAALVGGPVIAVHVVDNANVRRGDPLFDIDPKPYEVALERAQAQLAQAGRTAQQSGADVVAAQAAVARAQADLANFRAQLARTQSLRKQNFVSQQAVDDAVAKVRTQEAAVRESQAQLDRANAAAQGGVESSPDVLAARAVVAQAQLDLAHTHVAAPIDGRVTGMTLTVGTTVTPNAPLFALIASGTFRVDANFKETQLEGIRPGERADIVVDMYPHHHFTGVVQSVAGGTGTAFSLLPPQNATGNWVKVTQRVPVRVRFTNEDANYPLRVGATATVGVDLK